MTKRELTQNPFLKMEATLYGYEIDFMPGIKAWRAMDYPNDTFTDYEKFQKFLKSKLDTDFAGEMLGTKVLILLDFGRNGYKAAEIIGAKNPKSFVVRAEDGSESSIYREGLCPDTPKNRELVEALKIAHDKYLSEGHEIDVLREKAIRTWTKAVEPIASRVRKIAFEGVR